MAGERVGVALVKGEGEDDGGVPNGRLLVSFAEAVLGEEDAALARTRRVLGEIMGPEALVDAAAVVAGFCAVDRIADATGIPLDADLEMMSAEVRSELGLERPSADSLPAGR
jgi:hypothetical protein